MAREHGKQCTPRGRVGETTSFRQPVSLVLVSGRRVSDGSRDSDRTGRVRRRVDPDSDSDAGPEDARPR